MNARRLRRIAALHASLAREYEMEAAEQDPPKARVREPATPPPGVVIDDIAAARARKHLERIRGMRR